MAKKPNWAWEWYQDIDERWIRSKDSFATRRLAEDDMYSWLDRNSHRKARVVEIKTDSTESVLVPLRPRMDLVHPQIKEWMSRARDAMRGRKAIKFDALARECDEIIGSPVETDESPMSVLREACDEIVAAAQEDLKDAPKDSVAFGNADGRIEACRTIMDILESQRANGNIIAAAPDLLEGLRLVTDFLERSGFKEWDGYSIDRARAAIARATPKGTP